MSHFSVLVIGENVEEQLAPYQENNMGDCPEEYLSFNDMTDTINNGWENETMSTYYCNSGSNWGIRILKEDYEILKNLPIGKTQEMRLQKEAFVLYNVGNKYKVYYSTETTQHVVCNIFIELKKIITTNEDIVDVLIQKIEPPKEVSVKEYYDNDFEKFVEGFYGISQVDPKTGKYGYWKNTNRKWDWYQIGGRWTGSLKLKKGSHGITGSAGLLTPPAESGYVDVAYKKDIDFEGMQDDAENMAKKRYQEVKNIFNGEIPKLEYTWKDLCKKIDNEEISLDEARELYNNQEGVKQLQSIDNKIKFEVFSIFDGLDEFQCTETEYIERARNTAFSTFAVVKDGKWYEKGKMGWWATVSDEKDPDMRNKEFKTLIDELSEDTCLTVVDCHI